MVKGFYLAGEFDRGRKPSFIFLSSREKPFEFDSLNGVVSPKGIQIFDRKRHYMFPTDWVFVEGYSVSDIDKDVELRVELNEVWASWCKEHKRKYSPLLKVDEVQS